MDLTTVCLPNLISNDYTNVHPMLDLKKDIKNKKEDPYVGQMFDQTIIPTTSNKSLKQRYIETLANALEMVKK